MNLKNLVNKIGYECRKHSPEILMGLGIGGTVTATVIACRNTSKKVAPRKVQHDLVLLAAEEDMKNEIISEEEAKKEVKKECMSYAVDVAKAYAVPVTIEIASVACILWSNNIMRKRLAGVTATLSMTMSAFEAYRDRVRERYGEEEEMSIYLNERKVEIETTDEKGKTKKETITVADPDISTIGRYLTPTNGNFSKSEAFMENLIRMKDAQLNDFMMANGFIVVNNIYEEWGFETDTESGMTVGKVYNPDDNVGIYTTWRKETLLNDVGKPVDAYYLDWPGLEIIYGKGAKHRSIEY